MRKPSGELLTLVWVCNTTTIIDTHNPSWGGEAASVLSGVISSHLKRRNGPLGQTLKWASLLRLLTNYDKVSSLHLLDTSVVESCSIDATQSHPTTGVITITLDFETTPVKHLGSKLSILWWLSNSVSYGFDTAMKTGSWRQFKRYPTTCIWVSSYLSFTVD